MDNIKRVKKVSDAVSLVTQSYSSMPSKNLGVIYRQACMQYHGGQLENSLKSFRYLCLIDSSLARNFFGLGIVLKKMELYEQAILAFSCSHQLDKKNPKSALAMVECFKNLGEYLLAQDVLAEFFMRANATCGYDSLIKKATQYDKFIKLIIKH